ncbi:uncharacterized protein LOC113274637 [Papaver somniferum]|uniref:uncharacterized protein LOC113274637 n=1 Tax=Papaver somniferum TaxID=3469 RepID=UPI000E6FC080|nr:uncharacterized protein LOC113274637 [Papaver somniferum]
MLAVERWEWDMICNELGPVHGLNGNEDIVDFFVGFTVRKYYQVQVQEEPVGDFNNYLWKKNVPPKISYMLWAYFHDSLPTFAMLSHKRIEVQNENCLFCNNEIETADYMLLHCDFAFKVWSKFIEGFNIAWVAPVSVLHQFDSWKLKILQGRRKEIWWKVIYAVTCHMWKEMNSRNHGGRAKDVEELCLVMRQIILLSLSETTVFKDMSVKKKNLIGTLS